MFKKYKSLSIDIKKCLTTSLVIGLLFSNIYLLNHIVGEGSQLKNIINIAFICTIFFFLCKCVMLTKPNQRLKSIDTYSLGTIENKVFTPLTNMITVSDVISQNWDIYNDKDRLELIEIMTQSSNHLFMYMNSLFEFLSLVNGKTTLEFQRINIRSIVENVAGQSEILYLRQGINIVIEAPEDFFAEVFVDRNRISQAILHLIDNSVKFSESTKIHILLKKSRNKVIVTICDYGIGVLDLQIKDIFLPFSQIGDENNKNKGLGLGLATVRAIIIAHGGKIWVKNDPELGFVVNFSIALF